MIIALFDGNCRESCGSHILEQRRDTEFKRWDSKIRSDEEWYPSRTVDIDCDTTDGHRVYGFGLAPAFHFDNGRDTAGELLQGEELRERLAGVRCTCSYISGP